MRPTHRNPPHPGPAADPESGPAAELDAEASADHRLLAAAVDGDRRAGERLIEATYQQVFASLVKMTGDRDLAADLTQETYRRAWQSLASFDGRARVSTWLYRIAYTTFLNHLRRPSPVLGDAETAFATLEDSAPGADRRAADRSVAATLRRAVLALPDDLRETVAAHYWGDQSARDIADALGITDAAVRKRLRKARQTLRLALEETS